MSGASSSVTRCVITNDGSISPALDSVQQPRHVLVHVRLPHLQRQALGKRRAERELVQPAAIHAGDRDGAALAACRDRLPQRVRPSVAMYIDVFRAVVPRIERRAVRFQAHRVDARVRALPAGHRAQRVQHVDVLVVQRRRPSPRWPPAPGAREAIDRDHALGAQQERALDRELPHRTASPHGDGVARLRCCSSRRPCSRSERCRTGTAPARPMSASGTFSGPTSANGTRTYSAWPPG